MNKDVATLAKLIGDFNEALQAVLPALKALSDRIDHLDKKVDQLQQDMVDVLDTTGIDYHRWRSENLEEVNQFFKTRFKHWRDQGEGFYDAKQIALKELRGMYDNRKQTN